ncbi:hypothetical protein SAMN04488077_12027 [Roseovarius tolerans]|uniref:Uncharacterized protein n=1 Tax=Roseovarius tolerans TaxID=74031 RepID=A0A1H8HG51_9RHOB|nr:hypothetical protein SAMN04488077_12027 [Roseovarius tolerans]
MALCPNQQPTSCAACSYGWQSTQGGIELLSYRSYLGLKLASALFYFSGCYISDMFLSGF